MTVSKQVASGLMVIGGGLIVLGISSCHGGYEGIAFNVGAGLTKAGRYQAVTGTVLFLVGLLFRRRE